MVKLFYTSYKQYDIVHRDIFRTKIGKVGIMCIYI